MSSQTPVPYMPSIEAPEPDEAATTEKLIETLHKISETTYKHSGHGLRSVHAKSHGLITGTLEILPDLPPDLAQGLFEKPGTHPLVMRYSTNPGDILDDSITLPRGLAIKVMQVEGDRLPGSEGDTTQDFVLVDGPAFVAPNAKKFAANLKLLAATTDSPQILKKAISAALRGAESVVETFGGESATMKTLGGHPQTHPLSDTFYSQTPYRYGNAIAKFSIAPVSPQQLALVGTRLEVHGAPNLIRDALNEFMAANDAVWELRVQLCTDLAAMPIEDASVVWPEDLSPYVTVARIHAPKQTAWSETRSKAVDDGMAFSPWHGLAAHQPLGSINRVRRMAYKMSALDRAEHNKCPIHEPRGALGGLG